MHEKMAKLPLVAATHRVRRFVMLGIDEGVPGSVRFTAGCGSRLAGAPPGGCSARRRVHPATRLVAGARRAAGGRSLPRHRADNRQPDHPGSGRQHLGDGPGRRHQRRRPDHPCGRGDKFNLDDVDNPVGITAQGGNLWVTATNFVARFAPGSTDATATMINNIGGPQAHHRRTRRQPVDRQRYQRDQVPPGAPNTSTTFPTLITDGRQVVAGADSTVWATGGTQVIHFTTAGTQVSGSPYTVGGGPQGIAAGPGGQIAYGNPLTTPQSLGRITPPGSPELTNLGALDAGFGMTFANDGAYWFGQYNANNLGRLTPDGAYTTLDGGIPPVPNRGPRQITKGPGDTLWVTLDVPGSAPTTRSRASPAWARSRPRTPARLRTTSSSARSRRTRGRGRRSSP